MVRIVKITFDDNCSWFEENHFFLNACAKQVNGASSLNGILRDFFLLRNEQ